MTQNKQKKGLVEIFNQSPFKIEQENVIKFDTIEQQNKFFENSKLLNKVYSNDTFGYNDKEGHLAVDLDIETAEKCVYMRFKNNPGGRFYYAFILGARKVNRETTRLYFELDPINTYHFELFKDLTFNAFQCHYKRLKEDDTEFISDNPQGFNLGDRRLAGYKGISLVEWLIVVSKPTAVLNTSDNITNRYGSVVGSYKAFRYFIVPISMASGLVLKYTYNGQTTETMRIEEYMKKLTNTFNEETDTVNQVVNVYTTLECGIDYTDNDGIITINDTSHVKLLGIGKKSGGGTGGGNGGGTGGNTTGDYNKGELTNGDWHISQSDVNKMINGFRKVGTKVNYNFVLAQMWLESNWGNPSISTVATQDNNWSGISMPFHIPSEYGVNVTNGTQRAEGGYYAHFDTLDDYMVAYAYVLSEKNGLYKVEGKTTIQDYCKGLFTIGGASNDYAASGYDHYLSLLEPTYNAITSNNNEQCNQIAELSPKL